MSDEIQDVIERAIPLATLTASPHGNGLNPEYAETFTSAAVVLGVNLDNYNSVVVFDGRGHLQDVAHGGTDPGEAIVVAYHGDGDELEILAAVCQAHRGNCDYTRSISRGH